VLRRLSGVVVLGYDSCAQCPTVTFINGLWNGLTFALSGVFDASNSRNETSSRRPPHANTVTKLKLRFEGSQPMISRRTILTLLSASTIATSGVALAKKQKKHQNGRALLGDKIKQNGKHKLPKAGKVDVTVEVKNGKVAGLTATHPSKGNLQVRKVKSRQKLAETAPGVILAGMKLAQASDWYYGYWFVDDEEDDWYYWFTAEDVIVDDTWILFG
jgi:hypothetical protein